jgi:hypothetical protein
MSNTRALKFALVLLLCPAGFCAAADDRIPQIVGSARDADSGEVVYREFHYCSSGYLLCSVEYRNTAGELIAQKELDYRSGKQNPALVMKDYRLDVERSYAYSDAEDLVVDAGFDNFVRSKWDVLAQGESVKFPFQVVGFDKPLKMLARLDEKPVCGEQELCLEILVDSWFLGMLADPISLSYSRDGRKLLRFRGLSDIKGEKGESLTVDISYEYRDGESAAELVSVPAARE